MPFKNDAKTNDIKAADVKATDIKATLSQLKNLQTGAALIAAKAIKNIEITSTALSVDIELGYPAKSQFDTIRQSVIVALEPIAAGRHIKLQVSSKIVAHTTQCGLKPLPMIKNIIAVASGKGGVGKSTVAANLALALANEGAQVGILDADIYGPSQPMMMGIVGKPQSHDGKTMEALENYGIQVASIGFLVDQTQAMIWRGPMVTQALQQLLTQTNWRQLDYLIIDMPPGTGDIQLTLSQKVPVTGAVIVTTPQDIALLDARRGLQMFEKVDIPVLGIIENMALHICSQCGHAEAIFGAGGGEKMAAETGATLLGSLPLALSIRQYADIGKPIVVAEPAGQITLMYQDIARKLAAKIAEKPIDMSGKFPPIVAL